MIVALGLLATAMASCIVAFTVLSPTLATAPSVLASAARVSSTPTPSSVAITIAVT